MGDGGQQDKARNWTANQRQFIQWLALPSEYRGEIRKEGDFAKHAHVNPATLWKWKQLPGFWQEVKEACKQYLDDTVVDGLRSFKEQVRRGSFQHQKMYFEMTGLYEPKDEPKISGKLTIEIIHADTTTHTPETTS